LLVRRVVAAHRSEEMASGGGFNFENHYRNTLLEAQGFKAPTVRKTGTTIVGVVYKDGVVLGADTRATGGTIVCDKNCEKIHYIAPNIYCCGAGTAADTEHTTELISSQLALHRLATGKASRLATASQLLSQLLFRYQGQISAALVLGGVDLEGPHLYSIHPHGSVDELPFVTMGSGSLAAMSVFESRFKADMTQEEAVLLVHDAIEAGIVNDLGSGSNVDIMIITKDSSKMLRNVDTSHAERKYKKAGGFQFPRGTTAVLHTKFAPFAPVAEAMDTSDL